MSTAFGFCRFNFECTVLINGKRAKTWREPERRPEKKREEEKITREKRNRGEDFKVKGQKEVKSIHEGEMVRELKKCER